MNNPMTPTQPPAQGMGDEELWDIARELHEARIRYCWKGVGLQEQMQREPWPERKTYGFSVQNLPYVDIALAQARAVESRLTLRTAELAAAKEELREAIRERDAASKALLWHADNCDSMKALNAGYPGYVFSATHKARQRMAQKGETK